MRVSTVILPFFLFLQFAGAKNDNVYSRLYDDLFDDQEYQSSVFPRNSPAKPLDVETNLAPIAFDFDYEGKVVKVNAFLWMTWTDSRLSWNPEDYGGINQTHVPPSQLWTPDIEVYNAPSFGENSFSDQISRKKNEAIIYASGKVMWVPPVSVEAYCCSPVTIQAECNIQLGIWSHSANSINILPHEGKDYMHMNEFHYSGRASKFLLYQQSEGALKTKFYPQLPGVPFRHLQYRFRIISVSNLFDKGDDMTAEEIRQGYLSGDNYVLKPQEFDAINFPHQCI